MKRTLLLLACLVTLAACGGDSALPNPTGEGSIRMINAVPGSPPIRFLIEEQFRVVADYKQTAFPVELYDDFSYRFNFEIAEPGESTPTRIGSRTLKVESDREHIFLLTGSVSSPNIRVWDGDIRTFDAADTVLAARFSNAARTLGDIDIYFDPAGTVPGTNPPAATLSFREISDPVDYEAGEYILTVTAANDVDTVYFTSQEADLPAQFAHVITVFDGDANDTGPVVVRSVTGARTIRTFGDVLNSPTVRFIHTAYEVGAVDIYDDENLTNLVVANVPFRGATADLETTTDARTYYFTPAGSTAQVLFEQPIGTLSPASITQIYIAGNSTETIGARTVPDRAPHTTSAKLSIFNGSTNFGRFDAYLVEPGTELTDQNFPFLIDIAFPFRSSVVELPEGQFDLYLAEDGTRNAITPPFPLDLTNGSILDLIAVDTVDPAVLELVSIPAP